MQFSEKDMADLIGEVEREFADHLSKAEKEREVAMAKSEAASEAANTEENEDDSAELNKNESSESQESFDYDEEDFAEMDKLYSGMNKAEREAHYKSVKKALFGVEKSESETVEIIKKSESESRTEDKEEDRIAKSEFESVRKENEDLKKSLEGLTSALGKFLKGNAKAPKQKAITQIKFLKKNEEMEKSEDDKEESIDISSLSYNDISKRLAEKIRKGEIKKSEDREAIDAYYNERKSVDTIKHLL